MYNVQEATGRLWPLARLCTQFLVPSRALIAESAGRAPVRRHSPERSREPARCACTDVFLGCFYSPAKRSSALFRAHRGRANIRGWVFVSQQFNRINCRPHRPHTAFLLVTSENPPVFSERQPARRPRGNNRGNIARERFPRSGKSRLEGQQRPSNSGLITFSPSKRRAKFVTRSLSGCTISLTLTFARIECIGLLPTARLYRFCFLSFPSFLSTSVTPCETRNDILSK